MVARAPAVCSTPGCPEMAPCPTHRVKAWADSTRAARLPKDWKKVRARVLRRDGRRCYYHGPDCIGVADQVDHVVPNDNHDPANLAAICGPCHKAKSAQEAVRARWPR